MAFKMFFLSFNYTKILGKVYLTGVYFVRIDRTTITQVCFHHSVRLFLFLGRLCFCFNFNGRCCPGTRAHEAEKCFRSLGKVSVCRAPLRTVAQFRGNLSGNRICTVYFMICNLLFTRATTCYQLFPELTKTRVQRIGEGKGLKMGIT